MGYKSWVCVTDALVIAVASNQIWAAPYVVILSKPDRATIRDCLGDQATDEQMRLCGTLSILESRRRSTAVSTTRAWSSSQHCSQRYNDIAVSGCPGRLRSLTLCVHIRPAIRRLASRSQQWSAASCRVEQMMRLESWKPGTSGLMSDSSQRSTYGAYDGSLRAESTRLDTR